MRLSILSRNPPWPGRTLDESLTPTARLNSDSIGIARLGGGVDEDGDEEGLPEDEVREEDLPGRPGAQAGEQDAARAPLPGLVGAGDRASSCAFPNGFPMKKAPVSPRKMTAKRK